MDEAQVAEAERRRDIIARLEAGGRFDSATVEAAAAEFGASKRQFNRYRKSLRNTGAEPACCRAGGAAGGGGCGSTSASRKSSPRCGWSSA
ncbi:hypothetical protein ACRCPK_33610, partial [Pseudomonas aeruginosa]